MRNIDGKKVAVNYYCPICREFKIAIYPIEGFTNWYVKGMLIQEALPDITATEREILISNICPDCQKKIFK